MIEKQNPLLDCLYFEMFPLIMLIYLEMEKINIFFIEVEFTSDFYFPLSKCYIFKILSWELFNSASCVQGFVKLKVMNCTLFYRHCRPIAIGDCNLRSVVHDFFRGENVQSLGIESLQVVLSSGVPRIHITGRLIWNAILL